MCINTFTTNLMSGVCSYHLDDFLGKVIDLDECEDCDDEAKIIEYIKGLEEDKVMEMIMEYDQDYAILDMDEYVEWIDWTECVVWIVENYGSTELEGFDSIGLGRYIKVIAFQDICKTQYYEVMKH